MSSRGRGGLEIKASTSESPASTRTPLVRRSNAEFKESLVRLHRGWVNERESSTLKSTEVRDVERQYANDSVNLHGCRVIGVIDHDQSNEDVRIQKVAHL